MDRINYTPVNWCMICAFWSAAEECTVSLSSIKYPRARVACGGARRVRAVSSCEADMGPAGVAWTACVGRSPCAVVRRAWSVSPAIVEPTGELPGVCPRPASGVWSGLWPRGVACTLCPGTALHTAWWWNGALSLPSRPSSRPLPGVWSRGGARLAPPHRGGVGGERHSLDGLANLARLTFKFNRMSGR